MTSLDVPLLRDLTTSDLAVLGGLLERYRCQTGATILRQGQQASHLYLLTAGKVKLLYKPEDGPPITLTHLSAGDAFGWSAVIRSSVYTSSVLAVTPVSALRLRGAALRDLCRSHPGLGRTVLERLARLVSPRWKDSGQQVERILREALTPPTS